jgi:Protein of unknown function (DUF2958)
MSLLTAELRTRLPPIHGQEAEDDPVVYCRYFLPGTNLAWYPIEGQTDGDDFQFFGFVVGRDDFRFFRLSMLEKVRGPMEQPVERDLTFTEGRLTDVVPAPDL